jgi:hypothetical protein
MAGLPSSLSFPPPSLRFDFQHGLISNTAISDWFDAEVRCDMS